MKYLYALAIVLVFQFSAIVSARADEPTLLDGETAVIRGVLFTAEGKDLQERNVKYLAIRLNTPVTVADKVEKHTKVSVLKLLPSEPVQKSIQSHIGRQVQVKGEVLFRWYGPSVLPNSTLLMVQEVTAVSE